MYGGLGDLPFWKVDKLLANLFSYRYEGIWEEYDAENFVKMINGHNQLLGRAYDLRLYKIQGLTRGSYILG